MQQLGAMGSWTICSQETNCLWRSMAVTSTNWRWRQRQAASLMNSGAHLVAVDTHMKVTPCVILASRALPD